MIKIKIEQSVIDEIFEECDKRSQEETGGRLIGVSGRDGDDFVIRVLYQIGPGPNAKRSRTSFFQDGNWQEEVFRKIERRITNIQHLGNWHTHHVNGLEMLSGGDIETYKRIVNHSKHSTDFFYALLVTKKHAPMNYDVKNFILKRNSDDILQIPLFEII